MAKKVVLEVSNLTKRFGQNLAVSDVSFNVNEGEIVSILGRNGAGKTTTIQMLLGVLSPTSGIIKYFGKEFKENREEILEQINFGSSYIRLPYRLTVFENLDVMARLYKVKNRRERIEKLLGVFEMMEYINKPFASLSAGQMMRVILAKSFINYPKVLLLDEPTASLDPEVAQKVRDFLAEEQKEFGVTILLTSHNMAEVEELADKVIFLDNGQILEEDTPEGLANKIEVSRVDLLIDNKKDEALQICLSNNWEASYIKRYLRVELKEQDIAKLLHSLANAQINYKEISIEKPDLEDFFLSVGDKR